jgi:hypothetical protein
VARGDNPSFEGGLILGHACPEGSTQGFRAAKEVRQGQLGSGAHGEESIGDVLEPTAGFGGMVSGAGDDDPPNLELRSNRNLGETAQDIKSDLRFVDPRPRRRHTLRRVIKEDFVANDR